VNDPRSRTGAGVGCAAWGRSRHLLRVYSRRCSCLGRHRTPPVRHADLGSSLVSAHSVNGAILARVDRAHCSASRCRRRPSWEDDLISRGRPRGGPRLLRLTRRQPGRRDGGTDGKAA
jgi:hypothetical protein